MMTGAIIFNNLTDAQTLADRIWSERESWAIPVNDQTTVKYTNILENNGQYAVLIEDYVYDLLTADEKALMTETLDPAWFPQIQFL